MKIVILDAATLTINNDIDFSIFDRFGEVKIYDFTKDEKYLNVLKMQMLFYVINLQCLRRIYPGQRTLNI